MLVKWGINTGFPAATHAGEWEVPNDTSDEELDAMLAEERNNYIECWWEKVGVEDAVSQNAIIDGALNPQPTEAATRP